MAEENANRDDLIALGKAPSVEDAAPALLLAAPSDPQGSSIFRMFRFERRWMLRIFEAVLPSGAHPNVARGAADVPLGAFIDDLLERAPIQSVLGLRAGVWLMMMAPWFVLRRPRTFLKLTAHERAALLDRLRRSDVYVIREIPTLFKIVACLGYCGLPSVQQDLGMVPLDATPPAWARPREP
jgi:hypothetical protein